MVYAAEKSSKHAKAETSEDGLQETQGKKAFLGIWVVTERRKPEECLFKAKELVAHGEGKANISHLEYL